ncbi:MAG: hypothetical protein ABSE44_03230 [Candidatus Sulfotelmatobacter sp.]|jgi:hypothetical protein
MLQAHSFLWHYLWTAPNVLLFALALLIWRNGLRKTFPAFFAFALLSSLGQFALYTADVAPSVSAESFWRVDWGTLLIEGSLKFVLIGEVFAQIFGLYPSVARLGRLLIGAVGIALVLTSAVAAAYAPQDSHFGIISGAHLLDQTIYLIESGLLVFIFLFAAYFRLKPTHFVFGITLGLAISACVHLATWGIAANGGLPASRRVFLAFLNMATYHVCVLIWFYYLLVPAKVSTKAAVPLPENDLDIWNRELKRLAQQRMVQP